MAGCSGHILAVRLLGCTRIFRMAQQSCIARLGRTYQTSDTYRGQTGTLRPMRQPGGISGRVRARGLAAELFPISRDLVR